MKRILPWCVDGIGSDVRAAAKSAARDAGMPLGAWLTEIIYEAVEISAQLGGDSPPPPARTPTPDSAVDDAGRARPERTVPAILDDIRRLTSRIEDAEARALAEVPAPVRAAVPPKADTLPRGDTLQVDRAMARISSRLRELEKTTDTLRRKGELFGPPARRRD
jgi:localization factor PodJL